MMKIAGEIKEAVFVKRPGRFTALVELDSYRQKVYLPNSGRLACTWDAGTSEDVLLPGRIALLVSRPQRERQTSYDLVAVFLGQTLVWVDSRAANELVAEALTLLPQFQGYSLVRREVLFAGSRLDFLLANSSVSYLLEVKSVTLVYDHRALFPDAPTLRGTRHLEALIKAKKEGYEAAIMFVVQRPDAGSFAPNDRLDPDFGRVLRVAAAEGVGIYAYVCEVAASEIKITREVPILL